MLLDSVSKSIKVVLGGAKATADCPVTAFYVDHTDAGGTPGSSDTATNGVTAVTVVSAPAADTQRQVKMFTVYNADTASVTVYTQFVNGGTTRIMNKSTLAVGDSLVYQNEIGFRVVTATGSFLSDVSDRAARLLGVVSGAVTTDALKSSDLSIEAVTKYLNVNSRFMDTAGTSYGYKVADGKPRISTSPYGYEVAEGNISGHTPWSKIGYNPTITTADEDIWSNGGIYVFPTGAMTIDVRSDDGTADADIGTELFAATCDAGGSGTTMLDGGVNFAATAAAGDIILIEKAGTTPEWGVLTAVANGSVTFADGLSSGGSCALARTYQILDASEAKGAMAVKIDYLTATAYAEKTELITLDTDTWVPSINNDYFRINGFRVIAVGTKATALNAPKGNLLIRKSTVAAPIYSYIAAGFTRARNSVYTVPAGKTLYIVAWNVGAAMPSNKGSQTCRVAVRANIEPATKFRTGLIFYPFKEVLLSNEETPIQFPIPLVFPAKTDIKVSGIGLTGFTGSVTSSLMGWLE